jgi:hypothetical protein
LINISEAARGVVALDDELARVNGEIEALQIKLSVAVSKKLAIIRAMRTLAEPEENNEKSNAAVGRCSGLADIHLGSTCVRRAGSVCDGRCALHE